MKAWLFRNANWMEKQMPSILFSLGLYAYLILYRQIVEPDLREHIKASNELIQGKLIAHPVFFILLQVLSGFTKSAPALLFAAFILFSLGFYLKYYFSLQLGETILKRPASRAFCIILLLCQIAIGFVWLQDGFIKTSLSPNFFHNGTLLLSIPPSLYLLNQSLLFVQDGNPERRIRMLMAGLLILFTKPSFLFCWIPVMPLFLLLSDGAGKRLLSILQVAVMLIFGLILQSFFLRKSSLEFQLIFSPLAYFGTLQNHILVFASAVFFPIISIVPGWNYWKSKTGILLLLMCFQGLLISFCFFDSVKGIISPNMFWQSSIMHYLLLLYAGIILHEMLQKEKYWLAFLPGIAFLAQVFAGLQYLRISSIIRSFYF